MGMIRRVQVLSAGYSTKHIAKGKGVRREAESEGGDFDDFSASNKISDLASHVLVKIG